MSAQATQLAVIGGSGVYQMEGVEISNEHKPETPFGFPSDRIIEATVGGRRVYFLPRHGEGHTLLPTEVPYRANIYALKTLGVTHVMAISAVGIMQESIKPGDMVIPDQIFDRTKGIRPSTFFGDGVVGHLPFADPFCAEMRELLAGQAKEAGPNVHAGGTYVCMEGPQFSTRAESRFYRRALEPAVIGMTALPEAKLAREAEMGYAILGMATDYDCWNETEEDVSVEAVLAVLKANSKNAGHVMQQVAAALPEKADCECLSAAATSILTPKEKIPAAAKQRLSALYGRYWD